VPAGTHRDAKKAPCALASSKTNRINRRGVPCSLYLLESLRHRMLTVIGKGGKPREVPVPIGVIEMIAIYLHDRDLDPDLEAHHDKGTFLIGKVDDGGPGGEVYAPGEGIAAGTLYEQLKRFFKEAAKGLAKSDKKSATRLASASTHWLRHSHGSHAVAAGTPIEIVQNNLGHASLSTTTIYVTSEKKRRHQEMQ